MNDAIERLTAALIGRYAIERELGQGGMATVYLARDLKHDRHVALKVLKPELAAVLGAERFVVEIKTTASLQHPHILPLFDSGTADGFLFYVMPYIEGETLRGKLNRETQLGVDEAVRIATQVGDALDYAHRHGVIHRDIKPENILLHDGRPMVADFGIALAVSAAAGGRMTETGLSLGTPHYMSPEQATAEKEITARADIYSLGSVLFEMLTGAPPHVGANAQQVIMKIITEPAAPVTRYRKAVPANVAAAVARSLEKLPADRFETAKAFVDALGNAAFRDETTVSTGITAPRRTATRWLVTAGAVALMAGIGIGALLTRRPTAAPQVVRFTLSMKGQSLGLYPGAGTPFALSPDGTRIAFVASDSGGGETLRLRSLDQFTTTAFPGTEGAFSPFFSPDGLWIGFRTRSGISKVAVSGGPVSPVTPLDASRGAFSWSDDHFIVYTRDDAFMRVRDGGGAPVLLADSSKVRGYSPAVLPGGHALLMTLCGGQAVRLCDEVALLDMATGAVKVLVSGAVRGWYLPSGHLVYATRQGALFAVTFDIKSLAITSAPVGVLDGIQLAGNSISPRVSISSSGTLAYVAGSADGGATVVQVDRRGREQVLVAKPGSYTTPRLSVDGRLLALGARDAKDVEQVWIHDRSSSTTRQLTFEGSSVRPSWSPDGKRVAFSAERGGRWHVWSAPADGSNAGERVGQGPEITGQTAISWTRDGKWIVIDGVAEDRHGAGEEDIFAIPTTGERRTLTRAVTTAFDEESGEVSPDGKWIAYTSNDAGRYQVYIQPFLAPGGRTLISAGSATEPAWLSNTELAYVNNDADSLTVARLEFGATITVTRTSLFDHRPYQGGSQSVRRYDVSRDGTSFIFVKPLAGKTSVEPIIVLNWVEEVKRLMTAAGVLARTR